MASSNKNQPAFTLRDGPLQVTVWANSHEDKTFHSAEISRSYKDDKKDEWKQSNQFSGSDMLKAARLFDKAYDKTQELCSAE